MKHLWIIFIQISCLLGQSYDGETIWFYQKNIPGMKLNGKLISISEEHELDPNTGVTSEVTFKVDDYQLKMISQELIVGKVDESTLMFDKKSVYKITDDKGTLLFTNNKNLMDRKDIIKRQKTLSPSEKFLQSLVLSIGGCLIVFMFLSLYLQQRF